MAHEAAAAIRADQIACADGLFALRSRDGRGDAMPGLRERGQLHAEFRTMPQLEKTFAQHRFGQELRHHQRNVIRRGGRRLTALHHRRILERAIGTVAAQRRIEPARSHQPVDHA